MIFRITLVIVVFGLVTFLFKKASGSLKLTKLNMISLIYYFVLAFNLIGASLIYVGVRGHYLIQKIRMPQTIDFTYYSLAYAMIVFPLVMIAIKKIVNQLIPKRNADLYSQAEVYYQGNMTQLQIFVLFLMVVSTAATIYVFINLGYNPIVSLIGNEDINVLRQTGNRFFSGNQYVKNLLMSVLTPFVSYLTFIYYRITRSKTWKIMFIYTVILSIIVLTYDFAKSPIITFLFGFYLLEVIMGNVQNSKRFTGFAAAVVALILFFYMVIMKTGDTLFSIYSGPVGRVVFTQIATLFLHVDAFPEKHMFLNGASFNKWMSFLIPAAEGTRSGRVVMTIYNAAGIEAKTAGVMNTVFIGEAYANFGIAGIIIAPIVFGIIIGFFAALLPRLKKTPVSILFYVQMTLQFVTIVEGGFVDIFYNASALFILLLTIVSYLLSRSTNVKGIRRSKTSAAKAL